MQANYPSPNTSAIGGDEYRKKAAELEKELKKFLTADGKYINSLLGLLETLFSFIPSSTATNELCDISLYDHCKVTAAVAAAISEYLAARGADDFKEALFAKEKSFMDEKAFLLFSCDFSGIQKFIYMVEPDKALKSLRSRSFTLELFMEHIIDEIIEGCGLSRANLIYSGGGHAYILLPNTEEAKSFLRAAKTAVNRWLSKNFGTALFLASAWCECSPNDLRNIPAASAPYPRLFRELSAMLSAAKNARYSADKLRTLNFAKQEGGRECRICGTEKDVNSGGLCLWCSSFAEISNEILKEDIFISVTKEREAGLFSIELPEVTGGERRFAAIADLDKARRLAGSGASLRTYSKNRPHSGINYSTNLYMGDYVSEKEMSSLAAEAEGIERIAICRADVDNLGLAFTAGFQREGAGAEERFRYQTLSRSAAFSRGDVALLQIPYQFDPAQGRPRHHAAEHILRAGKGGAEAARRLFRRGRRLHRRRVGRRHRRRLRHSESLRKIYAGDALALRRNRNLQAEIPDLSRGGADGRARSGLKERRRQRLRNAL